MSNACIIIEVRLPTQILYKVCILNIAFEGYLHHVLSDGRSIIIITRDTDREEYLSAIFSDAQEMKVQAIGEVKTIEDKEESEELLSLVQALSKGLLPEVTPGSFFENLRRFKRFPEN